MTTHDAFFLSWSRPSPTLAARLATSPRALEPTRATVVHPTLVELVCAWLGLGHGGGGTPRPHAG